MLGLKHPPITIKAHNQIFFYCQLSQLATVCVCVRACVKHLLFTHLHFLKELPQLRSELSAESSANPSRGHVIKPSVSERHHTVIHHTASCEQRASIRLPCNKNPNVSHMDLAVKAWKQEMITVCVMIYENQFYFLLFVQKRRLECVFCIQETVDFFF